MKVAFHFNLDKLKLGDKAIAATLKAVHIANEYARTKIFTGSLLFAHAASETSHESDLCHVSRVDRRIFLTLVEEWAQIQSQQWHALERHAVQVALTGEVFAIAMETIDRTTAEAMNSSLKRKLRATYLGALEVDESLPSHLGAYQLCVLGRIDGGTAAIYWDGFDEEEKASYPKRWFKDAGFSRVKYTSLAGRYTIFDRDEGLEQSHRNGQTRQWMRELFDSVIDDVMPHLADGAPEVPEKLWSALRALRQIQVDEQASQVAVTCRRIFESVADALFPATDASPDGRKMGTTNYKNRLLKYLEEQQVGKTEKDLVVAAMDAAAVELTNLFELANKGLHSDFQRMQARRCLLRTLLLLDDLVALRKEPLATRIRHDAEVFRDLTDSLEEADE